LTAQPSYEGRAAVEGGKQILDFIYIKNKYCKICWYLEINIYPVKPTVIVPNLMRLSI
jgi:hypothetical protein